MLRKSIVFSLKPFESFLLSFLSEEKSKSQYKDLLIDITSLKENSKDIDEKIIKLNCINYDFYETNPFFFEETVKRDESDIIHICNSILKNGKIDDLINSKKIIFGSSFILKILLNFIKQNPNSALSETCIIVSERILRQMEVKREEILSFKLAPKDNSELIAEQIRMIIVMLSLYTIFGDLRFLNASIKAHDRIFRSVKNLCSSNLYRRITNKEILVLLYFSKSFRLQESLMSSLRS